MNFIQILKLFLVMILATSLYAEEREKLHVGFIASFSGAGAPYGQSARRGFELGMETMGESNLSLSYEDISYSAAKAVSAFRKLKEVDKAQVIVVLSSVAAAAIAPLAERQEIPLLACAGDVEISRNRSYVIRTIRSGEQEGVLLAKELANFSSLSLLYSTGDYPQSFAKGFQSELKENALKYHAEVSSETRDYKSLLLRAKKVEAEVIASCLHPGQYELFAQQMREIRMDAQVVGCDILQTVLESTSAARFLEGARFVSSWIAPSFAKTYQQRYGPKDPVNIAAIHYELAFILNSIAATKASYSAKELLEAIKTRTERSGILGPFPYVEHQGDGFFDSSAMLQEIRNGEAVPVKAINQDAYHSRTSGTH